jgi:hypothetical protein
MYEVRQPEDCEPKVRPKVTTGYFSDLAANIAVRLTTTSSSVAAERICLVVVVEVGIVGSGLRPGREPAERRLRRTCPLIHTSGQKS